MYRLSLAPDIQEEVFDLKLSPSAPKAVSERNIRPVAKIENSRKQRALYRQDAT
jgi:hypothetical protein